MKNDQKCSSVLKNTAPPRLPTKSGLSLRGATATKQSRLYRDRHVGLRPPRNDIWGLSTNSPLPLFYADDLSSLGGGGDGAADLLGHLANACYELGVRFGEHALLPVDVVLKTHANESAALDRHL